MQGYPICVTGLFEWSSVVRENKRKLHGSLSITLLVLLSCHHIVGWTYTGQDRTGQDRTGQDRTGQDRTGQDRTGQDRTGHMSAATFPHMVYI